jgi:hypothetical protein
MMLLPLRPMRLALAPLTVAAGLCACSPQAGPGVRSSQLDNQIAAAIGDPSTCLLLADAKTGQVVYRYGTDFNCARTLPACDTPGTLNAKDALRYAARPGGRMASCPSVPDGSRTVGWAEGPVQGAKRPLNYSAVMEGERALPGHEINARLFDAFQKAGL